MTDLLTSTGTKWGLTALLCVITITGFFLYSDRLGNLRNPVAIVIGIGCLIATVYQVFCPLWQCSAPSSSIMHKQEGGGWFVAVVSVNLLWFLASTSMGGVGEGKAFWRNPVVDLNNGVQVATLLLALSLLIKDGGLPRVDEMLVVWCVAFGLVLTGNYQALFDSHFHHLPKAITGHEPISSGLWVQWRITNVATLTAYCIGAIAVLHRVPMRWSCAIGFFAAVVAALLLYLLTGKI